MRWGAERRELAVREECDSVCRDRIETCEKERCGDGGRNVSTVDKVKMGYEVREGHLSHFSVFFSQIMTGLFFFLYRLLLCRPC